MDSPGQQSDAKTVHVSLVVVPRFSLLGLNQSHISLEGSGVMTHPTGRQRLDLAKPKSPTLQSPLVSVRTLVSLMSRCKVPDVNV